MATYNKFQDFVEQILKAVHDLDGTHTIKVFLTNTAPAASDTVFDPGGAHPPPAAANGYATATTTPTLSESSGTAKLVLSDVTFTASSGQIGPFRYVGVYNDTAVSDNLVGGYYDYGSSLTLEDTETFTVDFHATNGFFTIA